MATKVVRGVPLNGLDNLYINDTPVGNRSDNKTIADVQLVQLFLNELVMRAGNVFYKDAVTDDNAVSLSRMAPFESGFLNAKSAASIW